MILVTGGTGFLGAHLLVELTRNETPVRAIKRNSSSLDYAKRVFQRYTDDWETQFNKIEWVNADLLDIFSITDALDGVTHVYHSGGMVAFSEKDAPRLMQVNAKGTANLVNLCLDHQGIRLCHVSSIAAIGRTRLEESISEKRVWKNDPNNSWYAISKYNAEREVWRGIEEGLDAVIVNPAVILGYCDWDSGTGRLFKRVWNGLKYYTEGTTGWVDVKDVVDAMIRLMNSEISSERYIISAENRAYREIFNEIAQVLGKPAPSVKVTPFLSGLAWRMEKIRTFFTRKEPLITRATAKTARLKCHYENGKYLEFSGKPYIPMEETIKKTAALFREENP